MQSIIPLLLLLMGLGLIAAIAGLLRAWRLKKQGLAGETAHCSEEPIVKQDICCGEHELCESESLLMAVSQGKIEYFDDEELDRFKGRNEKEYDEKEIEEFEEILYTLRPEEVAPWVRSLQLRELVLPYALKDEVLMMVNERRSDSQKI